MINTIIIAILSFFLIFTIMAQPPTQETLGNAFNGDDIFVSKIQKRIKNYTFLIALIIALYSYFS